MTPEIITALINAPVTIVLIYLIIRMQSEKEKLIDALVTSERNHATDLVKIICSGKITVEQAIRMDPDTDRPK